MLGVTKEYMKGMINSLNKIIDSNRYLPLLYMTDAEPSLLSKKSTDCLTLKVQVRLQKVKSRLNSRYISQ